MSCVLKNSVRNLRAVRNTVMLFESLLLLKKLFFLFEMRLVVEDFVDCFDSQ